MKATVLVLLFALPLLQGAVHPAAATRQEPEDGLAGIASSLSKERGVLKKLAETLAKSGSTRAVTAVLAEVQRFGADDKEYDQLREKTVKALSKAKPARNARAAEKQLEKDLEAVAKAAEAIAAGAASREGAAREALYRAALRLDGGCVAAREGLGHAQDADGVWRSERERSLWNFAQDFSDVLVRARAMEFPLEDLETKDDLLTGCALGEVHALGFGGVRLEGEMPRAGLARRLNDVLRASAVANWLATGTLEPAVGDFSIVVQPAGESWKRYAEAAQAKNLLDAPEFATTLAVTGSWQIPMRRGGDFLLWYTSNTKESVVETFFKVDRSLVEGRAPREEWDKLWKSTSGLAPYWMSAGLVNLVGLSVLDEEWNTLPFERGSPADGAAVTAEGDELSDLRYRALLPGMRAWMADEVEAGRDLDMMSCLRARPGDLNSILLVQLTTMVEFLAAREGLPAVLARFREATGGGDVSSAAAAMAAIEPALGQSVAAFTAEWREWLLAGGEEISVSGLMRSDPAMQVDEGEPSAWVAAINAMRLAAQSTEVVLDETLSAGCRAWARDLDAGAAQPSSPAAAWASTHAVWAADAADPEEQLAEWMATVHLRVPLTIPTVPSVGIATAGDAVVVDATTLRHMSGKWFTHWPPHESRELPSRHAAIGPDPVPGEDTGTLGYPVTLVLSEFYGEPVVSMAMTGPDGPVDCWFTSPLAPLNPADVPAGTYALIPKAPLEGGRQYDVTASWDDSELRWTFITD